MTKQYDRYVYDRERGTVVLDMDQFPPGMVEEIRTAKQAPMFIFDLAKKWEVEPWTVTFIRFNNG